MCSVAASVVMIMMSRGQEERVGAPCLLTYHSLRLREMRTPCLEKQLLSHSLSLFFFSSPLHLERVAQLSCDDGVEAYICVCTRSSTQAKIMMIRKWMEQIERGCTGGRLGGGNLTSPGVVLYFKFMPVPIIFLSPTSKARLLKSKFGSLPLARQRPSLYLIGTALVANFSI